jgi:hypothetical protein
MGPRTEDQDSWKILKYKYTPLGNQSSRWRPLTCAGLHVGTELKPYRFRTSCQTHALIDWALPCRIQPPNRPIMGDVCSRASD